MPQTSVSSLHEPTKCQRPGCGASIPQSRLLRARERSVVTRTCCDSCRWKLRELEHPRQKRLELDPPAEPVQLIGPTPEQIRKAHKPQTVKVLRMLQAGPCTTHDFLHAFIGNHKARVYELRQAGWDIRSSRISDHSSLYFIAPEGAPMQSASGEPSTAPSEP